MRTLVTGDTHGAYRALMDAIRKAEFDPCKDKLIYLGDWADGWGEPLAILRYLRSLNNLVMIRGNHDDWAMQFLHLYTKFGNKKSCFLFSPELEDFWVTQGGQTTLDDILGQEQDTNLDYLRWIEAVSQYYYEDEENRLFVHGGIPIFQLEDGHPARWVQPQALMWDRTLFNEAVTQSRRPKETHTSLTGNYKEIYIGHTQVPTLDTAKDILDPDRNRENVPLHSGGVWCMDTGAGWHGVVTLMDVDTKEIWQSNPVGTYYPEGRGRK